MRRPALLACVAALLVPGSALCQARAADDALERLDTDIRAALSAYRWPSATWAVLVTSLDRGDTLFSLNPDSALAPASNMKLLTSTAALATLGPDFRFRSYLVTDGEVTGGVVHGDLVLYGTGDPGISDRFFNDKHTVFEGLADQLLASGVHTIEGDLVGDASFLPGPLLPPTWDPADLDDHFAAPISALSYNENVVSFRVEPAPRSGAPPIVHTIPEDAGLRVMNHATTVAGSRRSGLAILRDAPRDPFRVEGTLGLRSRDVWRQMTVPDPPTFAVSVLRSVLEGKGIRIRGVDRVVTRPAASPVSGRSITAPAVTTRPRARTLARHTSPPLRVYLAEVNKHSNNLYAELIFRTLGRLSGGSGAPAASANTVRSVLDGLGVTTTQLRQVDGSGLSASNRISAQTFVSLLGRVAESPLWTEFWNTLPTAGTRREMSRMRGTPAAGNLRAKTGTIEDVSALSGVVRSRDHERLAFSILVNGAPSTSRAKRVENRIGVALAGFSRGVRADRDAIAVVPDPTPPTPDVERYRVKRGESFTTIARRHHVSLDELMNVNPDVEPRRLQAGQWILIPPSGSAMPGAPPRS